MHGDEEAQVEEDVGRGLLTQQDTHTVDEHGWSGLIHAANASQYCWRAVFAAVALAPTSEVNLRTTGAYPPDRTALHFACSGSDTGFHRVKLVRALLDARAQLEAAMPNGTTPLLLAASSGLTDICRELLQRGADANAKNNDGKGALQLAGDNSTSVSTLLKQWRCPKTNGQKRSREDAGAPSRGKQARYLESFQDQTSHWHSRTGPWRSRTGAFSAQ